ncbi:YfiR family protein [Massilia consociata]|uniref:YfiR family protein n=1 Tax=Massilia consociata TaxID=760117 RepID=A0ABV6FL70_9BURK
MTTPPSDRLRRRLVCRALALPLLLTAAGSAPRALAQGAPALERRVKAAFLYKFLGYAEFPPHAFADATGPLTIAVVGSDDMAAELARIAAGRTVAGRPIVVRLVREHEVPPVHLLFVAGPDGERAGRVLRAAPGALLTVTECDGGLRYGSVINFRIVDERVRFDVSLDAAEKKNVKLSSRLLTVAHSVQKGGA